MEKREQTIKNVEGWPKKPGKADLLRHLKGGRLTRSEAIRARCYECVSGEDTRQCNVNTCPLTLYCQWNEKGHGTE